MILGSHRRSSLSIQSDGTRMNPDASTGGGCAEGGNFERTARCREERDEHDVAGGKTRLPERLAACLHMASHGPQLLFNFKLNESLMIITAIWLSAASTHEIILMSRTIFALRKEWRRRVG
jgi:hypothetical protein